MFFESTEFMALVDKIKIYNRNIIEDERGWFLKALNGKEENLPLYTGEIYITVANPLETKGCHYHVIANEWFTLLSGSCLLSLHDVEKDTKEDIELSMKSPITVYVPAKIAHAFRNLSSDHSFILLAYSDQLYDPKDTISFQF